MAPFFFTPVATGQNYFPEKVIVGTSLLDQDTFAQLYDKKRWAGGDPGHPLVRFGPGDDTAVSDARSVAFSATRLSPANGKPGSYVPLDGDRRFTADAWPRTEPAVGPVQPRTG